MNAVQAYNEPLGPGRESCPVEFLAVHLCKGHFWYLSAVLEPLRKTNASVYLVRTETFQDDLEGLPEWLGVDDWTDEVESRHDSYALKDETYLSPAGRELLRAAVQREYNVLQQLEEFSVNGRARGRYS